MPERRRSRRYAVSWSTEAAADAERFIVEVVNVSTDGLGLVSVHRLHVGGEHFFRLPAWTQAPLKGVVRWTEDTDGPTYAGIEFVEMNSAQRAALRALIAEIDREDWGTP